MKQIHPKHVSQYIDFPKNIMITFGMWLPPNNYVILHRIYMIIVLFTQFIFVILEFVYIGQVWGDLDEVSEASYLLLTQAAVCYKITVALLNKNNLIKLLEFMEGEFFNPQSEEQKRILFLRARTIKRLSTFFLTSALTTCTLWAMIPLFDAASKRSFPFKIWMPFGPQRSPHYELGYVYQMISVYISAFLFIAVDSLTLVMIMYGCAQLEIIMDKLNQIKSIPLNLKRDEKDNLMKENNELVTECVKQHQAVTRFIENVENMFHGNIFFQLSGTVGIICIIGLRISIVQKDSVQFFSMCNYMVTMLSQLFLYCWTGNEITIRSQDLRDLLYQCPWYEQGIPFRRSLWIAMERMKRPIIFRAGHYIPLSRPTFVSILRSSYSYFAVINQTNNK